MKIAFTGGGTGGHFYPLVAVAEAVRDLALERQLLPPRLYYVSDRPYDEAALFANDMAFVRVPAGKLRRYFSLRNVPDAFATLWGAVRGFFALLRLYPDVLVSKGGYASVPAVLAASVLRIPIIIHESDAKPGRANLFAAGKAARIAVGFESAIAGFGDKARGKAARTGNPVRKELLSLPDRAGALAALGLDPSVPTLVVLGGSSGSVRINETLLDGLPQLVRGMNVVHQTGRAHAQGVASTARVILHGSEHAERYHPLGYLDLEAMRNAAAAADVIVTRAGAGSITEVSLWGVPAILIPIPESVSHDQRTNAYAYARTGAATVIEEANLTPNVLASEALRIGGDAAIGAGMRAAARGFSNPDAARIIADEALRIALSHERK